MLRRWDLQTPLAGVLREHQCPRCRREVDLPLGQLCHDCLATVHRRATRIARRAALWSTALLGLYIYLQVPRNQAATMIAAAAAVAWYGLSYLVAKRIAKEFLK